MDVILDWLAQLEWEKLISMAMTAFSALLCITIHEVSHGLAALSMGDSTAKRAGRLSMNPLKHIDLVGLAMLTLARVGWAKPVPIDPRYFKNRRLGMAVTALAGPAANLILASAAALGYGICLVLYGWTGAAWLSWVVEFLMLVLYLSVGLAAFNLLPIPPLDGSKVLLAFLPERWYWQILRYERFGMIALVVLLMSGLLDWPLDLLQGGLLQGMGMIADWAVNMLI